MGSPRRNEPHPGPDLTTPARPANDSRLLRAAETVDEITDVAHGKYTKPDVDKPWLRTLAADMDRGVPSDLLTRWVNLFSEEIETVRRARNNILYGEPIDDANVAAAADIAERLIDAAKRAGEAQLNA